MKKRAFIVGTGGHAQMLHQLLSSQDLEGVDIAAWLETEQYQGSGQLFDRPVIRQDAAGLKYLKENQILDFYFGIGMVKAAPWRMDIYNALLGHKFFPRIFIHPTAIVDPSVSVAEGCFIGAGCIVQPFVHVGKACILNTGSIVEHHVHIAENVHIAPGVIVCGQAQVATHSMIGAGSIVLQGVHVGQNVTIGAGSIVLDAVSDNTVVMGRPVRPKV